MSQALLMATVTPPEGDTESEPVTVIEWPDAIELVLDDGTRIVLDRAEFAQAVNPVQRSAAA